MNLLKRFIILGSVVISSFAIAQSASARFVIFVAGNDAATLQRVRNVSPAAFATKINAQSVIQAGSFNSETGADSLAISLQQSGLAAQKYFMPSDFKDGNLAFPLADTTTTSSVVIQQNQTSPPVNFPVESQPQVFNSIPQTQQATFYGTSDVSLLPQQSQNPNFRYVAAVPAKANNQFLISQVRQFVPSAFYANSSRGTYIHAGAYQNRDSAEAVSRYLRAQGIDSRVLYF